MLRADGKIASERGISVVLQSQSHAYFLVRGMFIAWKVALLAWAGSHEHNSQCVRQWVSSAARTLAGARVQHLVLVSILKWICAVHKAKADRTRAPHAEITLGSARSLNHVSSAPYCFSHETTTRPISQPFLSSASSPRQGDTLGRLGSSPLDFPSRKFSPGPARKLSPGPSLVPRIPLDGLLCSGYRSPQRAVSATFEPQGEPPPELRPHRSPHAYSASKLRADDIAVTVTSSTEPLSGRSRSLMLPLQTVERQSSATVTLHTHRSSTPDPWVRGQSASVSAPVTGMDAPSAAASHLAVVQTTSQLTRAPLAVAGVDTNHDGRANFLYVGVDRNRDGIPDALQVGRLWH